MVQSKQKEWHDQWILYQCKELFLFTDWIHPRTLDDFKNKNVLEAGCGGGQHTGFIAPYAKHIVAVDLNTVNLAKERNKEFNNISYLEYDIAEMDLKEQFEVVFSIGVIHHTDNPDKSVNNLKKHVKSGGLLILWVYSKEGNFLVEYIIEPIRKLFLKHISRRVLSIISQIITVFLYIPIYTVYLFPLKFLPYYDYCKNFRKLPFRRNALNIFDKLNAPQVEFFTENRVKQWFKEDEFEDIQVSSYRGVSWRASGRKK